MKKFFYFLILFLFIGFIIYGFYNYFNFYNNCQLPRAFAINNIDTRFNISKDSVKNIAIDASNRWNNQTQVDLIKYNENAALKINLIYDSRQENLNKTQTEIEKLTNSKTSIDNLETEYKKLLAQYQNDLANYNAQVAYWNSKGGAPTDEYSKLQDQKSSLDQRKQMLLDMAKNLNLEAQNYNEDLSYLKNDLDSRKNTIITQGEFDPNTNTINIYTFGNNNELRLVLMHEFGHALGLDHANNQVSILYELLDQQNVNNPTLTSEDISLLTKHCQLKYKSTFYDKIFDLFNRELRPQLIQ